MAQRNREDEEVDRNGQRQVDFDYDRSRAARPDWDRQDFTRGSGRESAGRQRSAWSEADRGGRQEWERQDYGRGEEHGRDRGQHYGRGQQYGGGQPSYGQRGQEQEEYGRGFERGFRGEFDGGYGRGPGQGFDRGPGSGGYDQWGQEAGHQRQSGGFDRGPGSRGREGQWFGGEQWYGGGRSGSGRGMHTGHGPKGYRRSDDRVHEDVCEKLTEHGEIDARELEVKVQNGEVTLSGTVPSRQAKRMAEDVAEEVAGVKEVSNLLRVKESSQHGGSGHERDSGSRTGSSRGKAE